MQIYHQAKAQMIFAVFLVYMGVALEYLQGVRGVRHFEVSDMLANASGVIVAWVVSFSRLSRSLVVFERILLSFR